jgi:hypothetical protein
VVTSFDRFDQLYTHRRLDRAIVADRLGGLAEPALCMPHARPRQSITCADRSV